MTEIIKFNIGGQRFECLKSTLLQQEHSFFTALLESGHWTPNAQGEYFIDRDPYHFQNILNVLRGQAVHIYKHDQLRFLQELDYFQISLAKAGIVLDCSEGLVDKHGPDSHQAAIFVPQRFVEPNDHPQKPYEFCWQIAHRNKARCPLYLQQSGREEQYTSVGSAMVHLDVTYNHPIPRHWDAISDVYLHITAGPLPAGCTWKRWWPLRLLESSALKINDTPIVTADQGWSEMRQFMLADPRYINIFDIADPVERLEYSRYAFEAIVPVEFMPELKMIALRDQPAVIQITLANVNKLINSSQQTVTELTISVQLRAKVSYLLVGLRLEMFMTLFDRCHYYRTTKHELQLDSRTLTLPLRAAGHCEAVYLWVTDEHNEEIPTSIISTITCLINETGIRERISGLEARHVMPRRLPHPTKVPVSRPNAYFLSFVTEQHEEGLHLNSTHTKLVLEFGKGPSNICIYMALAMRSYFSYAVGKILNLEEDE